MSKYLSPKLETVTPYTPGEQPQDQQYIKLNTNESPYLPSPAVVAAVSAHEVEKLRLYSDPACPARLKPAATAVTRTSLSPCGPSATRPTRWPMPTSPTAVTASGAG